MPAQLSLPAPGWAAGCSGALEDGADSRDPAGCHRGAAGFLTAASSRQQARCMACVGPSSRSPPPTHSPIRPAPRAATLPTRRRRTRRHPFCALRASWRAATMQVGGRAGGGGGRAGGAAAGGGAAVGKGAAAQVAGAEEPVAATGLLHTPHATRHAPHSAYDAPHPTPPRATTRHNATRRTPPRRQGHAGPQLGAGGVPQGALQGGGGHRGLWHGPGQAEPGGRAAPAAAAQPGGLRAAGGRSGAEGGRAGGLAGWMAPDGPACAAASVAAQAGPAQLCCACSCRAAQPGRLSLPLLP
jgi:hypothetical protein